MTENKARDLKPATLFILTVFVLFSFAGNSALTRHAIDNHHAGPIGFTIIRNLSGAPLLVPIVGPSRLRYGSFQGGLLFFTFALPYSIGYATLSAAAGALVQFSVTQFTIIQYAIIKEGKRLSPREILGLAIAISSLVWFLAPRADGWSINGILWMGLSGIIWGFYSLLATRSENAKAHPLSATAGNFAWAAGFATIGCAIAWPFSGEKIPDLRGFIDGIICGAITSGIACAAWYSIFHPLGTFRASIAQLAIPVIAAIYAVLFLSESLAPEQLVAGTLTLSGMIIIVTKTSKLPIKL